MFRFRQKKKKNLKVLSCITDSRGVLIEYSALAPQTGVKQESTDVSERDKHSRLQAPSSGETQTPASSKCIFFAVFFQADLKEFTCGHLLFYVLYYIYIYIYGFFFPIHMFRGNGTTSNTPAKHMRPYSELGRQITGIRRVLLSRRRISETAGGSPQFAAVPDSARVSTPVPGKPLIMAAQRRRLKGMLPVVCLSRLAAVLLPAPGGARRLSSAFPLLSVREAVLGGVMPRACLQSSHGENVT